MVLANSVMLIVFLLSAVVQYNDPDAWRWIFYYGVAAGLTMLALAQRYHWITGVAALGFYGGFVYCVPGRGIDTLLLLKEPKMSNIPVEEAREAFGLLICAVWMSVLTWVWYRRRGKTAEAGRNLAC